MAWNEAFKRLYPASADLLRNGISRQELRKAMLERGDAPTDDSRSSDWDSLGQWDRVLPDGRIISVDRMATSEGGRLVLQSDVTALRRTAEVLARNERMASLGNLVAGIAHEINTPIGNALMVASAVGQPASPNSRRRSPAGSCGVRYSIASSPAYANRTTCSNATSSAPPT